MAKTTEEKTAREIELEAALAAVTKERDELIAKSAPAKKDNRYTRAFRLIAADPAVTADTLGTKGKMSTKSAASCLTIWEAAVQVLGEHNRLTAAAEANAPA